MLNSVAISSLDSINFPSIIKCSFLLVLLPFLSGLFKHSLIILQVFLESPVQFSNFVLKYLFLFSRIAFWCSLFEFLYWNSLYTVLNLINFFLNLWTVLPSSIVSLEIHGFLGRSLLATTYVAFSMHELTWPCKLSRASS